MSSLYQLDEETKELLTLDNFLKDLSISEFVDRLSKQNVEYKSKFNNGVEYIDPKPYIRTFELVEKQLDKLDKECSETRTRIENQVHIRSLQHYKNVLQLNGKAADLDKRYKNLSSDVSKLYDSRISPMREKLTQAKNLKEHSEELIFVAKCYNEFYINGKPPSELVEYKFSDLEKISKAFNQLLSLSSKLSEDSASLPKVKPANEAIIKCAESFEQKQLQNFVSYYDSKDSKRTRYIAKILFNLNGGTHIVETFVEHHPLFGKLQSSKQPAVDKDYWLALGNPDEAFYSLDQATLDLFNSIGKNFDQELPKIIDIFEDDTSAVLESLISKLFSDIIHSRVDYLIKMASSYSKLAFLRILHLVATELYRLTLSKMTSLLQEKDIQLTAVLDKAYTDIFASYLKHDAYFKVEKANLLEMLDPLTVDRDGVWTKAAQKHALSDKIASFKDAHTNSEPKISEKVENDETSASSDGGKKRDSRSLNEIARDAFSGKQAHAFTSISGQIHNSGWRERLRKSAVGASHLSFGSSLIISSMAPSSVPTATQNANKLTSLQIVQKVLNYVVESLNRSIELVPGKINEYSMDIFDILMFKIGPSYILPEMESLYYNDVLIPHQKLNSFFTLSSTSVNLDFLPQFSEITFQLYLLSLVVRKSFYPLLLTGSTKAKLVNLFNGFIQDMEIGLNITLNSLIDLIEANIKSILNRQNTEDFCPSTQNVVIDKTQVCDKLTQFIEYTLRTVHMSMASNPFFEFELIKRISALLLTTLIAHFQHFKVNSTGSLIITQDIIHYISVFDVVNIDDLKKRRESAIKGVKQILPSSEDVSGIRENFSVLKELANLFSCQPELLSDLCNEGKLANLKRSVLREYIRNRIDFKESFLNGI